jgi:hypothetical protein
VTAPAPAPSRLGQQQDPVHIACATADRTWCGEPADEWVTEPDVDDVCRLCLLVLELLAVGDPCPVCGTHRCLDTP